MRLTLQLGPAVAFEIDGETVEDLINYWQTLGGDGEWLTSQLHDVVKATEEGPGIASVLIGLGGVPIVRESDAPPTRPASGGARRSRGQGAASAPPASADARNDDAPDADPGAGTDAPPPESPSDGWGKDEAEGDYQDPWDKPDEPTKPTKPAYGQSNNRAARDNKGQVKDNLGRLWTLNLPDAPFCECGDPAGKVAGKSQKTGKRYTIWKCAKDAPGGNYHEKCDFSEFPD